MKSFHVPCFLTFGFAFLLAGISLKAEEEKEVSVQSFCLTQKDLGTTNVTEYLSQSLGDSQVQYELYPSSERAKASMLQFLQHTVYYYKHVPPEIRSELGVRDQDMYFFHTNTPNTYAIQSGRLLIWFTLDDTELLKTILRRWYACEPQEFPPPESLKTLEVETAKKQCVLLESLPITYPFVGPDGAKPFRIQLIVVPPPGPCGWHDPEVKREIPRPNWQAMRFVSGGFHRQDVLTGASFVPQNPFFFSDVQLAPSHAFFLRTGTFTIRCYHFDEAGQLLAWGETKVEVKAEE